MSNERPILFSAPMVRAILDGSKTQTRRIMKPQPTKDYVTFMPLSAELVGVTKHGGPIDNRGWLHCPYGRPGDRLWVREKHAVWERDGWIEGGVTITPSERGVYYWADQGAMHQVGRWTPSIHMPRWASRITLEVDSVRVERLQDISQADAFAEGIPKACDNIAIDTYAALWQKINGPGTWDANPWVWVITFKRIEP